MEIKPKSKPENSPCKVQIITAQVGKVRITFKGVCQKTNKQLLSQRTLSYTTSKGGRTGGAQPASGGLLVL